MLLENLDLEKSLDRAAQLQEEARKRQVLTEEEVNRATLDIAKTSRELQILKAKLQQMNDEGSSLGQLEKEYQLLSLEFKEKSENLKRHQQDNSKLRVDYSNLAAITDPEKAVLSDRLVSLNMEIEKAVRLNEKRAEDLKGTHTSLEIAKEVQSKGQKGREELARTETWLEKKIKQKAVEIEKVRAAEKEQEQKEKEMKELEGRVKSLKDEILAGSRLAVTIVQETSKNTLELMNSVLARDRYRQQLESMLRSHRASEVYLNEKLDMLRLKLKNEDDKNNALALINRDNMRKSQVISYRPLTEKLEDIRRVYEIKERNLDSENVKLRATIARLELEMDAIDIQEIKDNEANLQSGSYMDMQRRKYSDINSLIESISLDGIDSASLDLSRH